jgi:hypothetical protein
MLRTRNAVRKNGVPRSNLKQEAFISRLLQLASRLPNIHIAEIKGSTARGYINDPQG